MLVGNFCLRFGDNGRKRSDRNKRFLLAVARIGLLFVFFLLACPALLVQPALAEEKVEFDAPSIVQARVLETSHAVTVKKPVVNLVSAKDHSAPIFREAKLGGSRVARNSQDASASVASGLSLSGEHFDSRNDGDRMLIEIVVPVSSVLSSKVRKQVEEFRFDVFWNRSAYPLIDYGPRTLTTSPIAGTIAVEKSQDRKGSVGLNLSGKYESILNASAQAQLSGSESRSERFQEIPQHEVLVASGSIRRGTGAFFRFHPSRHETLEGGRDLVVVFRVPRHWRGGVLQVECRANGSRKIIGSWNEPFEQSRVFIVPVCLENDDQARQAATEFVRSEQSLRASWNNYLNRASRNRDPFTQFQQTLTGQSNKLPSGLEANWVHWLIQSGDDRHFEMYQRTLPRSVREPASYFVQARKDLEQMSR